MIYSTTSDLIFKGRAGIVIKLNVLIEGTTQALTPGGLMLNLVGEIKRQLHEMSEDFDPEDQPHPKHSSLSGKQCYWIWNDENHPYDLLRVTFIFESNKMRIYKDEFKHTLQSTIVEYLEDSFRDDGSDGSPFIMPDKEFCAIVKLYPNFKEPKRSATTRGE